MLENLKKKSALFLIFSNLIPLYGVFFQNWDLFWIVFLYWSENLIIGFFNILKLASVKVNSPIENLRKLFTIPLFIFHFGAFCSIHFILILALFKKVPDNVLEIRNLPFFSIFIDQLTKQIKKIEISSTEMIIPFLALFLSHGFSFTYNYLIKGKYKNSNTLHLMLDPYWRIIFLHIAIIVGAYSVMYFDTPIFLLVTLILIKIIIDLYLHIKQHSNLQRNTY